MSAAKSFFDTNVLVYSVDFREKTKRLEAQLLIDSIQEERSGVVSYQVLQEFVNVMRRARPTQWKVSDCESYVGKITKEFEVVEQSKNLLFRALHVHERHRIPWYDSLIVAAAQSGGCSVLYSEDLSAGQNYGGVKVVNPFR